MLFYSVGQSAGTDRTARTTEDGGQGVTEYSTALPTFSHTYGQYNTWSGYCSTYLVFKLTHLFKA